MKRVDTTVLRTVDELRALLRDAYAQYDEEHRAWMLERQALLAERRCKAFAIVQREIMGLGMHELHFVGDGVDFSVCARARDGSGATHARSLQVAFDAVRQEKRKSA
jgi:hypothetical protein